MHLNLNTFEKIDNGIIGCLGEFLVDNWKDFCNQFEQNNQHFILQTLRFGHRGEYYNF